MRPTLAALIALALTACTPTQVHWFTHQATPHQRAAVVDHLQQRPTDCYSALGPAGWPASDQPRMRRIIWRESRNQPTARNPRSSAAGCAQLLAMHDWRYREVGCTPAQKLDAVCNLRAARHLFLAAGWQPWSL